MARPEKIRLGDLLIQQGLLTDEQLKFALDEQKRSGRKLGRIVVDSSFVTEEAISQALARQLQITYVDLKHFTPKPELISPVSYTHLDVYKRQEWKRALRNSHIKWLPKNSAMRFCAVR